MVGKARDLLAQGKPLPRSAVEFESLMDPNWMKSAKAQLDESRAKATTGWGALLEYAAGYYPKLMR